MNYLTLSALNHYANVEGQYQRLAKGIYTDLRNNLVKNIIKEYRRTGYIWEQYDDKTGNGKGSHPFTGWSALVVLMMAEEY
jgi:mannosyl-oligosaccharide glucosidase